MPEPLDQRFITVFNERTKRDEEFPALHPRWVEQIRFVIYQSPPLDSEDIASVDQWKERVSFIQRDLTWLLQLPHERFWCQAIFDETLHRCVDSYLKHAPRSHDVVYSLPQDIQQLQNNIHHLVYLVCVRMATYKESKDEHLTPSEFAKIIYENYLFDIPKLMDLCVLYGASYHDDPGNKPLLTKMITNIFSQQPSYEEDLYMVVPTILQVMQNIAVTCGVGSTPTQTPLKLDTANMPTLIAMDITQFQDVLFYLADTAHTLWLFLDVYPPATKAFMQQDFLIRLASMYESLFPAISNALEEREWTSESYRQMMTTKVHRCQHYLLRIFRQIISQCCLMPLLEDISAEKAESLIEDYLHYMSGVLGERRFLCHYERLYPFTDDRDILLQAEYPVDETQLRFILDAIREAAAIFGHQVLTPRSKSKKQKPPKTSANQGTTIQPEGGATGPNEGGATAYSGTDYEGPDTDQGACAAPPRKVTAVEMDSMISSVKDLLPDLGDGFIQLCLEELDFNTEQVINMLLENSLPKALQKYDRNLPRLPTEPETVEEEQSVLSERRNIYDNDEFDVFSRDTVDTKRIHRGKKEKNQGGASGVLDDKSVVSELRPLYDKYGAEDVESMYDVPPGGYDDEYDDTYDECTVGATDADNLEELTHKKRFIRPPQILGRPSPEDEESDSEEEEEGKRRDTFIEDPAKIRQRQEERRQSQMQGRRGYKPPSQGSGQRSNQGQGSGQRSNQGQGSGQRSNQGQGSGQRSNQGQGSGQRSNHGQGSGQRSNQGRGSDQRSNQGQGFDERSNQGQGSDQGQRSGQGEHRDQGEGRRNYDVKGTAKGQGQSADVLKNRAWKEKHKSSRVNHNRRNLADKKRKV